MILRYLLLLCCGLHTLSACAQTAGQYQVLKRRSDGKYDSYGVTLSNGQAIGQAAGIPAAVTVGGGSGTGTVTSVALTLPGIFSVTGSPITDSGTLSASLATQTANQVWAGPTTGSAAAPTFRALVANDLPDLSSVYQPIAGILTAFSGLSNAAGVLTNNGSGSLSYTATSTGGNKDADSGKLVKFDSVGGVYFSNEVRIYPYPSGSNFLQFNNSRIQWLRGVSDYCAIIPSEAGSACTFYFPTNPGNHTLALEDGNITGTAGGLSSTLAVTSGGTGQTSYTDGQLLIGNTTGNTLAKATLTAGSGISITNGHGTITIASTSSGGTVTSVAASVPAFLSISGSPITSSGTLAITLSGTALPVANGGTGITAFGTGIATALGANIGSAGAPVLFNGAGGTPSSIVLTNATGTAAGLSVGAATSATSATYASGLATTGATVVVSGGAPPTAGQVLTATSSTAADWQWDKDAIVVACSDETTDLTTGTAKVTFRMPYAMTLTGVRLSVNTAPTGSVIIVDVKEAGTTIFSTKPQIATSAKTSVGGAVPGTLSDASLADEAEITINIDQIGSTIAGKGLKVTLIGTRQ